MTSILAVLHLSDIHWDARNERTLTKRLPKIVAAVERSNAGCAMVVIAISGDIANTGDEREYGLAHAFLTNLSATLKERLAGIPVHFVLVPGNHDCSLGGTQEIRNTLIGRLLLEPRQRPSPEVIAFCTEPQSPFFSFMSLLEDRPTLGGDHRLVYTRTFSINNHHVTFRLCNTAWMSTIREKYGQLLYPTPPVSPEPDSADLVVTMYHHPSHWLEPENGHAFRTWVEGNSDVILTGHEHRSGQLQKHTIVGGLNEYFEGGALHPHDIGGSDFRIILIDFDQRLRKLLSFTLSEGTYSRSGSTEWLPFVRGSQMKRGADFSDAFARRIDDPGAEFTHPAKGTLRLRDLFVFPRVREFKIAKQPRPPIPGRQIIDQLDTGTHVLISGEETSGKTAFALTACRLLHDRGKLPVLLDGESLRSLNVDNITSVVVSALTSQYSERGSNEWFEAPKDRRVVVLDDLHRSPLSRADRDEAIGQLRRMAGSVAIFTSDVLRIEDLSSSDTRATVGLLSRFELLPFGHELRHELATHWHALGREDDPEQTARRTLRTEQMFNIVIGKDIVPSYPIFLLILVQQEEAMTSPDNAGSATGSYGYLYEFLITRAIASAKDADELGLDTGYKYLAELAYHLFSSGARSLSQDELGRFHNSYCVDYSLTIDAKSTWDFFLRTGMLRLEDHRWQFKYRYGFFYFVARSLRDDSTRFDRHLPTLLEHIFRDDDANIIIFLAHLTRDQRLVGSILDKARTIFADSPQFDLASVPFLDTLGSRPSVPLMLAPGPVTEHRRNTLRERDVHERELEERAQDPDDLVDVLRINVAMKTLTILGQILKSFPGSIKGDVKLAIAHECYALGLRTLHVIVTLIGSNLESIKGFLSRMFRERGFDEAEAKDRMDGAIYWIVEATAFSILRKTAESVGLHRLSKTYDDVLAQHADFSISMVDIAVRLEYLGSFPENEISTLAHRTSKSPFPRGLLKLLVRHHFYLHESSLRLRQRVCKQLEIAMPQSDTNDRLP